MLGQFNVSRNTKVLTSAMITACLTGCTMPNSSNPTVSISEARVAGDTASLRMQITNPSDMDLRIESADWSLLYGPLPVSQGTWELGVLIPKGGTYGFDRQVRFSSPPLDAGADEVELTGTLDVTTVGDSGNTALQSAGFSASQTTSH